MNCDFKAGQILLVDKPKNWTSFDVVAKIRNTIRRYTGQKVKVGHGGTLDPLATGLLIVATGRKTKELSFLQAADKEYIATIRFGAQTLSYDAETEIVRTFPTHSLNEEKIRAALNDFLGPQLQVPPPYSAKKIRGKKAYELARSGQQVNLKPVHIEIKEIEILSLNLPELTLRLLVSKGTYIRSFAHDLGVKLGCGAYLLELRRTKVGQFSVANALSVENLLYQISQCSKN